MLCLFKFLHEKYHPKTIDEHSRSLDTIFVVQKFEENKHQTSIVSKVKKNRLIQTRNMRFCHNISHELLSCVHFKARRNAWHTHTNGVDDFDSLIVNPRHWRFTGLQTSLQRNNKIICIIFAVHKEP